MLHRNYCAISCSFMVIIRCYYKPDAALTVVLKAALKVRIYKRSNYCNAYYRGKVDRIIKYVGCRYSWQHFTCRYRCLCDTYSCLNVQ